MKLENEGEAIIWSKSEREIAQDLINIRGSYRNENGNPICLELEDFIVEKCKMDHGCKDENPLREVRFVRRVDRILLDGPIEDYPEAVKVDESDYDEDIPRSFQKNCIRVYARDPTKEELLYHVFLTWKLGAGHAESTPALGLQLQNEENASNENDSLNGSCLQPLTQDSEDESSPQKESSCRTTDFSPIPSHRSSGYKKGPAWR